MNWILTGLLVLGACLVVSILTGHAIKQGSDEFEGKP